MKLLEERNDAVSFASLKHLYLITTTTTTTKKKKKKKHAVKISEEC